MKKLYFYLLFLPLWGLVGIAHASVAVQVLATDFTNKTVTLHVEYDNAVNDCVWVWIYLCSMQGMFEPAEISAASATSGSVLYLSTNTRGFFVTAGPATVTATLSNVSGQFSCCAYGSDTPPNMMESNGTYTFKGTPPFTLIDADRTTTQTVTGNTLLASALTITPVTITDETGYPDIFSFCNYTGSDLYWDVAHFCRQRPSGARNWEAYIKDVRDNQIYRIVKMPNGTWWMADDLVWDGRPSPDATNYTVRGSARECGEHYGCGRFYQQNAQGAGAFAGGNAARLNSSVCPAGWFIPSLNELLTYNPGCVSPSSYEYLSELEFGGPNTYGLSLYICNTSGFDCGTAHTGYRAGNTNRYVHINAGSCSGGGTTTATSHVGPTVRCVRDL